jgi:hypothetical protein
MNQAETRIAVGVGVFFIALFVGLMAYANNSLPVVVIMGVVLLLWALNNARELSK